MNNMVSISIVMPLYNASRYLGEALVSVLKQTHTEFELICVNDASDDNTLHILQSFCKIDSRIKVLSNEKRMGAAYSRNRGMKEARGKYIIFLDGDDIFDEDMLQSTYQEMERTNADIVMYECATVSSEHIYEKQSVMRSENFIKKYCKQPFSVKDDEPIKFMQWMDATWSRLYRKSFVEDNCLEFQTLACANDVYFSIMALMLTDKIIMLGDRRVMVYARNHSEISRISYDRDPMCTYLAVDKIGKELSKRKLFREYSQYYYCLVFYDLNAVIKKTKPVERAESFYRFLANEGIDNLIAPYEKDYAIEDSYIKELFENFKKYSFESMWYKHENIFKYYMFKNADNVLKAVKNYINQNIKIIVWGAGIYGRILLNFFDKNGVRIDEVVDKDVSKQGDVICGYVIKDPQQFLKNLNLILVTSDKVYTDIHGDANIKGIEIVNVKSLIGMAD